MSQLSDAHPTRTADAPAAPSRPGPVAGWLFLVAGVTLIAATLLIPASDSLADARWRRDQALALEEHQLLRIERHEDMLAALDRFDPELTLLLASSQLGLAPPDRSALTVPGSHADPRLFESLEPMPTTMPEHKIVDSRLARWTRDEQTRLWLFAGAMVLVLLGLLPAAHPGRRA